MKNYDARIRSRKLWDKHGSVLLLVVVLGLGWNGGMEWQRYKTAKVVEVIVEAGRIERDDLRSRLREVNRTMLQCTRESANAAAQAGTAAAQAGTAVQKAEQIINTEAGNK